jgi:hypothetical protein
LLLNQTWQTIAAAWNEVMFSKLVNLKDLTIATITKVEQLHGYHASLARGGAPAWFDEFQRWSVIENLIELVQKFPDATNLISAVFQCLPNATPTPQILGFWFSISFFHL